MGAEQQSTSVSGTNGSGEQTPKWVGQVDGKQQQNNVQIKTVKDDNALCKPFEHLYCVNGKSCEDETRPLTTPHESAAAVAPAHNGISRVPNYVQVIPVKFYGQSSGSTFVQLILSDITLFDSHIRTWNCDESVKSAPTSALLLSRQCFAPQLAIEKERCEQRPCTELTTFVSYGKYNSEFFTDSAQTSALAIPSSVTSAWGRKIVITS